MKDGWVVVIALTIGENNQSRVDGGLPASLKDRITATLGRTKSFLPLQNSRATKLSTIFNRKSHPSLAALYLRVAIFFLHYPCAN